MKQVYIAVLGFGTVGYGVYQVLRQNGDMIAHREGLKISIKRILVKDFVNEPNYDKAPKELFVTGMDEIMADPEINIVVECMGGIEPARTCILQALDAGKSVVTSNKEVISKHWYTFDAAARRTGAGLYIEATVGGGIPLIRALTDGLQASRIDRIMGIINGTTNFILTKMSEEGLAFEDVLREAQANGFAEANPAADVEGYDACYKLSILSSLAFHTHIPVATIYREGITRLTVADFEIAKQLGYEIKLLAIGKKTESDKMLVETRVHPTMLKKTHPLASIRGSFNAVFLHGNTVDDVMLYGRGAGQLPTASAVLGDVIYACHHEGAHPQVTFRNIPDTDSGTVVLKDWDSIYCIRLRVADRPGVLSSIAGVFANHNVSLKTVLQSAESDEDKTKHIAKITFITHMARELSVQAALKDLVNLECTESIDGLIRVEE
ncbi:MAG: homoserine dehydrogenase [Clostridiales bacterium]|jgi:homoserine dehydrogenase|nr:homoserine dehydrogenase [Clostridiales bacterium]